MNSVPREHRSLISFALLCVAIAFCAVSLQAQSVIVQLRQPPPNQLKIADLWQIQLTNPGSTPLRVYLHGTGTEASAGLIVDATSAQFTVPVGVSNWNGNTVAPIKVNSANSKYKDALLRTGQVPTGNYHVCVEVVLVSSNQVIGTDCFDQDVQVLSPPILVMPNDGSVVEDKLPNFSWLPPSPLSPGQQVRYTIKVVEILGRQTPYDAFNSNPAWFQRTNITGGLTQYPISARSFTVGKRYAWDIKALNVDGRLMGESEIWWFTYQPEQVILDRDTTDNPARKDKIITFTPPPTEPTSIKLKGGLQYVSGEQFARSSSLTKSMAQAKLLDLINTDKKKENAKKFLEGLLGTCSGTSFTLKLSVDQLKTVSPLNKELPEDKLNMLVPMDNATPVVTPK